MATKKSSINPIQITPGVQPSTDRTPYNTPHYTFSDKIRFWRGVPQKIGGWLKFLFENDATISGVARTLYSVIIGNIVTTIIGTNSYLYSLFGQTLTNITPIDTSSSTAIPNSLNTIYETLGANPITTILGSNVITIQCSTDIEAQKIGDLISISGATAVGGIGTSDINTNHTIHSIDYVTDKFTVVVSTNATSSATGGGSSVVYASSLIVVGATAHGLTDGQRVKIAGAANTGGILAANINQEFIARVPGPNKFDIITTVTPTSSVSNGGGSATIFYKQLAAGDVDERLGIGYGVGLYGVGLYGTSKTSGTITYPRIWFPDRFGDRIIVTPGNQGPIYSWDGNNDAAPALLANAPTAVNYLFVSNNILVTFGYQNVPNQIFTSDIDDPTNWTASSSNQVFQDVVYGAEPLISSVPVLATNLLFTQNQTYTFSYIGLPLIWNIQLIDNSIGIIAPMARCSVNNVAYWMGQNNFYYWAGGNVSIIPASTQSQSTLLNYVFSNLNRAQIWKSFAWYNQRYNEVWFHYPSSASNECDSLVKVTLDDLTWSPDTLQRGCAEYPQAIFGYPRLIDVSGNFYNHETGNNADTEPLPFTLTSNLRTAGKETAIVSGFVPDSLQTGDISVNVSAYQWPQALSTPTYSTTFTINDNAVRENIQIGGRFWQYTWSGDVLDQNWVMGSWFELLQESSPN